MSPPAPDRSGARSELPSRRRTRRQPPPRAPRLARRPRMASPDHRPERAACRSFLCRPPCRDRGEFVGIETFGDAAHHGRWPFAGTKRRQRLGHLLRVAPGQRQCRAVTTGTGRRSGRWRRSCRQNHYQPKAGSPPHVARRSPGLNGNARIRLPVAAKIAFNTAGPATAMVGSPTPPQNPPDGTSTVSTFGMPASRIT